MVFERYQAQNINRYASKHEVNKLTIGHISKEILNNSDSLIAIYHGKILYRIY